MAAPNYDYLYQPGGSLGSKAPSYVARKADTALFEALKTGNFCYVFNCRQMGKSSLRVRVGNRLKQAGYLCAALDLSKVGGDDHLSPDKWYRSLIADLNRALSLLSDVEFDTWLAARDGFTASYTLTQFIEEVVLAKTQNQPVVIFIDEIDSVLSLAFDTNDLFAVIRACYNQRADNPDYERLNFALFGVATPAKLMRDTSRTPFNIGKAIRLMPLDLAQASPLEAGLIGWVEEPTQVLLEIFEWTGGQPYLTQKLCELVQEYAMENGAVLAIDSAKKVTELVEQHILKNWQLQDEQNHLKTIQDRMLRQGHLLNRVLDLYSQVLNQGELVADVTDEATVELRLSGAVIQTEKMLKPFNRIYRHIFNAGWVAETLANLRPHAAMFEAWVASGCKDTDFLLRKDSLKAAEAWAEGKSLSDLDNRYLRESQRAENKTFKRWAQASSLVSGLVAVGMLVAAAVSYRAYISIEKKVTASELRLLANDSKRFLSAGKPIEALTTAVRGGEIVQEQGLQSTQEGALVLGVLHQARYPNSSSNVQKVSFFQVHNQLSGHAGGVSSVSFSPDGQTLASASENGTVKLWTKDGELIEALSGHSDKVRSLSFSPDGQILASASDDGTMKLWTRDGVLIETLSGHSDRGRRLSPDGQFWQLRFGRERSGFVRSLSFSPDGQTLASASEDGTVKLWTRDGVLIETLSGYSGRVRSLSFSPDGQTLETLASASWDGTVKLWTKDGELIETLSSHSGRVNSVSFSPDGQILASAGEDGTVKLWTKNGVLIETLSGRSGRVNGVSFSPGGQTLASASADGTMKLWTRDGELIETLSGYSGRVRSLSFSPDGQTLETLASANADGTVKLWAKDSELIETLSGHPDWGDSVSFSPDGQTLVLAGEEGTVKLWTRDGELIETLSDHSDRVNSVSFSPDGQTLVSASADRTVKLWTRDGVLIETLSDHSDRVNSVSFSPDGQTLASASEDGTVKLWTRDGVLIETLSGYSGRVSSVNFSPDGQTLALAGDDGTVQLWTRDGELIETLSDHLDRVSSVSFSPDGQTLAVGGEYGIVQLWTKDGELIETLSDHAGWVSSVSFSPDGQTLASAGEDGTVKLWTRDGELIETLSGHSGRFNSVSFSPDGQTLAVANEQGTVKLWDRNLKSLLARSCDWLTPYLRNTPEGQTIAEEGVCEEYL